MPAMNTWSPWTRQFDHVPGGASFTCGLVTRFIFIVALLWVRSVRTIRLADEAWAEAGLVGGPAAGHAAAEDRGPQHRALEPGPAVDVPAGHAGDLARGVEAGDGLEVMVQHPAAEVGLHAAEVLPGEREELDRVVGRGVERLRLREHLAERG